MEKMFYRCGFNSLIRRNLIILSPTKTTMAIRRAFKCSLDSNLWNIFFKNTGSFRTYQDQGGPVPWNLQNSPSLFFLLHAYARVTLIRTCNKPPQQKNHFDLVNI